MQTDSLLVGLRAAGEPTRLRLLALCSLGELTVTELVNILGQSQPRVSRHLKLMVDAGLLDRFREGTWAFYRLGRDGGGADLARILAALIDEDDPVIAADLARLEEVKEIRQQRADAYFRAQAPVWNEVRALYVPEAEVERAMLGLFAGRSIGDLLDVGTGTGRALELMAGSVERAVGIDLNREMLAVARARIEELGLTHCQVRHGDVYRLPFAAASFDAVTVNQVLHFVDDPAAVLRETARVMRPGARVVVVDFAPHDIEDLRENHAHRRLGFSDGEVEGWFRAAGLVPGAGETLPGDPLTVRIWAADAPPPAEVAR